jgi:hypothetical protein
MAADAAALPHTAPRSLWRRDPRSDGEEGQGGREEEAGGGRLAGEGKGRPAEAEGRRARVATA